MKGKLIWSIFWVMVVCFIILLWGVIPKVYHPKLNLGGPAIVLNLLLGITLVVLAIKSKVSGWLKKSLILTGIAPVGIVLTFILADVIGSVLHITSPIGDMIGNIIIYLFMAAFIVGAVSSIVLARRHID